MATDNRNTDIVFENARFRLVLSTGGQVLSFIDKRRGRDVCAAPGRVAFCSVQWGECGVDAFARKYEEWYRYRSRDFPDAIPYEQIQPATALVLGNNRLSAEFGDTGVAATFQVSVSDVGLVLEVVSVSGPAIDAITVASLPVDITRGVARSLNACYDDEFAAWVLGLTPRVNAFPVDLDTGGVILTARCSRQFGMVGQRVAVLASPRPEFKPLIQNAETTFGLPSPRLGGA